MSGSSSPFDASASALGYLYQCRYALLLALERAEEPNVSISIEKLDDDRIFVCQLLLVGLSLARLRFAQEDHYRAFTQRSRWVKNQLVGFDEETNYEARLIAGWRERFAIMREGVAGNGDDTMLAQHGLRLYEWIVLEAPGKCQLWVRSDFQAEYMVKGSYHMLADQLRVGWHPEYEAHLKPPVPAGKPTKQRKQPSPRKRAKP